MPERTFYPSLSRSPNRRFFASVGASEPFSPVDISGLELWLKADDLTGSDGSALAAWPDASGNARNVVQAGAAHKPSLQTAELNGLPVVRFAAIDDTDADWFASTNGALAGAGLTTGAALTCFIVCKATAEDTDELVLFDSADVSRYVLLGTYTFGGNTWFVDVEGDGPNGFFGQTVTVDGPSIDEWAVLAFVLDPSAGGFGAVLIYSAGTLLVSGSYEGFDIDDLPLDSIYVGRFSQDNVGVSGWMRGDIAEVLLYSSALSDTDRDLVGNYLADKYALTWV